MHATRRATTLSLFCWDEDGFRRFVFCTIEDKDDIDFAIRYDHFPFDKYKSSQDACK